MFPNPRALILALSVLLPASALAEGNIHIGKLQVHPSIAYQATHDSNIFKESSSEKSDFIHVIKPGIHLLYEGVGDNSLELGYDIGLIRYTDYTDNNFHEHAASLTGKYQTPMGFYTRIDDAFAHTADPHGNSNSYRQNDPKVRRWYNTAALALGYEFNRLRVEAGYANRLERYLEEEDWWQNRDDNRLSLTGYYRFLPRTSALLEYRLTDTSYGDQNNGDNDLGIDSDTSQDSLQHQVFAGLRFDPSGKLKGDVKFGVGRKNYDNEADWNGQDYEDVTSWLAESSLDWAVTAKTSLGLDFSRSLNDSTESYATRFTTTALRLDLKHEILTPLAALADASVSLDEYDDISPTLAPRDDVTLGLGAGLEYSAREWLTMGLGYRFEDRSSSEDFSDEEYQDHRTTLTLLGVF